ncbi:MAG: U32 family peptidase [Nanobdellota archaeon]
MRLSVGLKGDIEHANEVLSSVGGMIYEVFVGVPPEISASGRIKTAMSSHDSLLELRALTKKYGIRLVVLLNASCYGGEEFSNSFKEKMLDFLDFLEENGFDGVVIANSMLLDLVLKKRKNIEVSVSTFNHVDNPVLARAYEKKGVERIKLPHVINRDLRLLRRIKNYIGSEIEMYANGKCLYGGYCPHFFFHRHFKAHYKIKDEDFSKNITEIDPYLAYCVSSRKNDLLQQIMAPTIRPEDLHIYEEMGIDIFKLALRQAGAAEVIKVVKAYYSRKWDGTIGELWTGVFKRDSPPNYLFDGLLKKIGNLNQEDQIPYFKEIYNRMVSDDKKIKEDNSL